MSRRRKKVRTVPYRDVEINVMPFIDVFSMLNTFLLFSAVFLSIGIIEVQVPFLTNAPPPKEQRRAFDIKVDITKDGVDLTSGYTTAPKDERKAHYLVNDQGMTELHVALVASRRANEDTDKITVFSDDDVIYDNMSKVLDAVKLRRDGDPVFSEIDSKTSEKHTSVFLYPKVVLGSVILR